MKIWTKSLFGQNDRTRTHQKIVSKIRHKKYFGESSSKRLREKGERLRETKQTTSSSWKHPWKKKMKKRNRQGKPKGNFDGEDFSHIGMHESLDSETAAILPMSFRGTDFVRDSVFLPGDDLREARVTNTLYHLSSSTSVLVCRTFSFFFCLLHSSSFSFSSYFQGVATDCGNYKEGSSMTLNSFMGERTTLFSLLDSIFSLTERISQWPLRTKTRSFNLTFKFLSFFLSKILPLRTIFTTPNPESRIP